MAGVTCRSCSGSNASGASTCQFCGFPLPRQRSPENPGPPPPAGSTSRAPAPSGDPFNVERTVVVRAAGLDPIHLQKGDRLLVGRSPDSPLSSVCADNISRQHAEIYVGEEGVVLMDTDSTNGTFVDGTRLAPRSPFSIQATADVHFGNEPPLRLTIEVSP